MEEKFVGYEYTEVEVKRELESFYMDYYPSFGWEFDSRTPSLKSIIDIKLKFKRNREIKNKTEVMKQQRQFEKTIKEIQKLEMSKVIKASAVAYVVGIIGTAFMAGAVFSVLASNIVLCVVLGIIGCIGWVIPYWLFKNISKKMTENVEPEIDGKYDEINEICKKATDLRNK